MAVAHTDAADLNWLVSLLTLDGIPAGMIGQVVDNYQNGDERSHLQLLSPKAKRAWHFSRTGNCKSKLALLDPRYKRAWISSRKEAGQVFVDPNYRRRCGSMQSQDSKTGGVTRRALADTVYNCGKLDKDRFQSALSVYNGMRSHFPNYRRQRRNNNNSSLLPILGMLLLILAMLGLALWHFELPPFEKKVEASRHEELVHDVTSNAAPQGFSEGEYAENTKKSCKSAIL